MKKIAFLALIIAIFALTGCAQKQTEGGTGNADNQENFAVRRPDFGQPKRDADIRGFVKSIVGNEIKIFKIERPQLSQETLEDSDENAGEEQKTTLGTNTTGTRMPGMGGGMRSSGTRPDEDARAAMLERMKEMSTGEETILVPVGIQMLKPDEDKEKMELVEATLEDIKEDKMLQIWLNESVSERKVAEFVLITR